MMTRGNERQIWRYQREVIRNRKSNGKMKKKKKQRSTKHYIEIKKMLEKNGLSSNTGNTGHDMKTIKT
jgi:hypothetical protein